MASRKITISAAQVRNAVSGVEAPALDPADCRELQIPVVYVMPDGRVDIVDGYHRIAGMLAYGAESIECVTTDDFDLLADAGNAEQPSVQRAAIEAIYSSLNTVSGHDA